MLAKELIGKAKPIYQQYQLRDNNKAWVKAYALDDKNWWHVHRDEKLPSSLECSRITVMLIDGIEISADVLVGQ